MSIGEPKIIRRKIIEKGHSWSASSTVFSDFTDIDPRRPPLCREVQNTSDKRESRCEDMCGVVEKNSNDAVEIAILEGAGSADTAGAAKGSCTDRSLKPAKDNTSLRGSSWQLPSCLGQSMSSNVAGNTTDNYAVILSFNYLIYLKKTFIVACIHVSSNLKFRIIGYAKSGLNYYNEICGETAMAHGDVQPIVIGTLYNVIAEEVKLATSGKVSSFALYLLRGYVR